MSNTTGHTAKCLKCGRVRRFATAEAAAKAGPTGASARCASASPRSARPSRASPPPRSTRPASSSPTAALIPTSRPGVFRAVSSKGTDTYLTHSAACNCPGGLRSRTGCYHSLAARIIMASAA